MDHLLKKSRLFRFIEGNYNLLLIFLGLLFIFRPYNHNDVYVTFWKILFVGTIIFSIFNAHHSRKVRTAILVLAVPSVLFTWINSLHDSQFAVLGITISSALFIAIAACSILHDVIVKAKVTLETLRGAICAYFLIAFFFSYVYLLAELLEPGTILIRGETVPIFPTLYYFYSEVLYYSFVTLLTIGYGDIVTIKDFGQTATVIEGTLGQFYIAILVARLVAVYSILSNNKLVKYLEDKK